MEENIYRYGYVVVYNLNQSNTRRKDASFRGGGDLWPQEKEGRLVLYGKEGRRSICYIY